MEKLASQQQKRMFFALSHQLGYDPKRVKERAKEHFNLKSLNDATVEQMNYLIDKLLVKEMERQQ